MVSVKLVNVSNEILHNISTVFPSNKVSMIIGPNGAGKTTLLKTIAGLKNYEGTIYYDEQVIDNTPPYMRSISFIPQNNVLFQNMSVLENLYFPLKVGREPLTSYSDRIKLLVDKLGLEKLLHKYPSMLSTGEAKRVAIARGLVPVRDLYLIDEPYANLDIEFRSIVKDLFIDMLKNENKTVLLVSHIIDYSINDVDKLYIMWRGRIVFSDKPWKLDNKYLPLETRFWLGSVIDDIDYIVRNDLCYIDFAGYYIPIKCVEDRVVKIIIKQARFLDKCSGKYVVGKTVNIHDLGKYYGVEIAVDKYLLYFKTYRRIGMGEKICLEINEAIPLYMK